VDRNHLSWLLVALAGVACHGSSPSEPEAPRETASIVFVDAAALAAHKAAITALLHDTVGKASRVLPVGTVQFLVYADAARSVPGWGMGGFTLGPSTIEIVIDPAYGGLEHALTQRLPAVAAHELHHAVRLGGLGPYRTLLEGLVFEGLADHFAIELLGTPPPPWCMAFPEGEVETYLGRARPELDSAFDFGAWFFGIGTDLPRWTGYTLGFHVVGDYLSSHPGTSAAGLVHTPAAVFRPAG
jgi:uncharacterized protein YjaZ